MTKKNNLERRPDSAATGEHRSESPDRSVLVHLTICLGIGVALVAAINLLGWLA